MPSASRRMSASIGKRDKLCRRRPVSKTGLIGHDDTTSNPAFHPRDPRLMREASLVEQVRLLVRRTFMELQIPVAEGLEETILIRNGFYCGRRFATTAAHAVWFCEENQLKFYGPQGTVLHVLQNVDQQAAGVFNARSPMAA